MTHPSHEDWISYLYDELDARSRITLNRHLEQCAECTAQLAGWRATGQRLDTYAIAASQSFSPGWSRWSRWVAAAAAASIVLSAGFVLGRLTGVSRGELAALHDQMTAFNTQLDSRTAAIARAETQQQLQPFTVGINQRLQLLQAQQATDYASLRKELETVAVYADAGFRHTENQIVQLATTDTPKSGISNP